MNINEDQTSASEFLTIKFTINELNYLQEQISRSQNEGKIFCNKKALSYALIESNQSQSLKISEVIAIFKWNQPGEYYGKSYCKVYIGDERRCYQADIPEWQVQKILNHEVFEGRLLFTHPADASECQDGWLKLWRNKFSILKSLI